MKFQNDYKKSFRKARGDKPRDIPKPLRTIDNRVYSLKLGNIKLSSNTLIWSLPPIKTCPYKGICAQYCYANRPYRLFPTVRNAQDTNLLHTKRDSFEEDMIHLIRRLVNKYNFKYIRIHESGEVDRNYSSIF